MENVKRNLLKSQNLTNGDLEKIYLGQKVGDWVLRRVIDEFEGPDGWRVIEFEFINLDTECSEPRFRGLTFTGRIFFKICDSNDPYGRYGHVWESTLLGERNYPW